MPACVLSARKGVHVKHGVEALSSASFHDPIDELEALLPDSEVLFVVHEVAMVDRYAYTAQAQRGEELGVFTGEEVVEELCPVSSVTFCKPPGLADLLVRSYLVKEEVVLLLPEHLQHCRAHLVLMARISGDEVLHTARHCQRQNQYCIALYMLRVT